MSIGNGTSYFSYKYGGTMQIPDELIEQFARGNGAIFVGEALSKGAGVRGQAELMNRLASELRDYLPGSTLQDITQYYENEHGRNRLITLLRDELDTSILNPTPVHQALLKLPINYIFTTNYDDLLEKAARIIECPHDVTVRDREVLFRSSDRLQLVKLYGNLGDPDSIVITDEDYARYFAKHPSLTNLLTITFQVCTVLFLGYSANERNLQLLLAQVRGQAGNLARNLYTVQFGTLPMVVKDLDRRGVKVIDLGPQSGATAENAALVEWLQVLDRQVREHKAFISPHATRSILRTSPLSSEVKGLLNAMGFQILKELQKDGNVIFQAQRMTAGEDIHRWFLCQESPVTIEDIIRLEMQITTDPTSKGWIVTLFAIDNDARKMLESHPIISAHTLADFYQQMLRYDNYLRELIESAAEVEKYWVDLESSLNQKGGRFNIVEYVDAWISSPARNHLALLGDFGTGKTSFCRYYAAKLARQHLQDPAHHRIPLLISLKGYAKSLKLEQLITDSMINSFHIDLVGGFKTFLHLNKCGRLLLIFDGFDEMEQRVSYSVALRNYEDILRAVVDNSKVILTSRPIFFSDKEQLATLLKSTEDRPKFEMLFTLLLEDHQIQKILRKRLPDQAKWEECWNQIRTVRRLRDLASRPVMIQIISETLPTILAQGPGSINGAALYRIYVNEWIEEACRKDSRLLTMKEEVLSFLHDIAWDIFCTHGTGTITRSEFRESIENRFKPNVPATGGLEDLFIVDRTTTNYTFPHISFMEYLVADKIVKNLCDGEVQYLFMCTLTEGVLDFLIDLASSFEAQVGILNALLAAQSNELVDRVIKLLTRSGDGNPVRLIIDILTATDPTMRPTFQHEPASSTKDTLLTKVIDRLTTGISKEVVNALGKEDFLKGVTTPIQDLAPFARDFLFELLSSPAISTDRTLKELSPALYEASDLQVRLHAVQVLGKRRGEKESQVLIELIGSQEIPPKIREACIDNLQINSLSDSAIRTGVLKKLHKVINNEMDDIELRSYCVIQLAEYDSAEALRPLVHILKDFNHSLWLVSANIISRTSVLSLANDIEQEVILPNQTRRDLIRDISHLRSAVAAIKKNAQSTQSHFE